MKNKRPNSYGTFSAGKPWYFRSRLIVAFIGGGILIVALVFTLKPNPKAELAQESDESEAADDSTIPGWWLAQYFGASICQEQTCAPASDPDEDKLTNEQEFFYHADPLNPDTNQNGADDGEDVAKGFDPSRPGSVTFAELESEENVLGESIVFDEDIEQMVAEDQDISKVNLSQFLPLDSELKIDYATDGAVYKNYVEESQDKVNKYFAQKDLSEIMFTLESAEGFELDQLREKSRLLSAELRAMTVPYKFLSFHRYTVAFYRLLAEVVPGPELGQEDAWYDQAQAFLAVQQKLAFENELLKREFGL